MSCECGECEECKSIKSAVGPKGPTGDKGAKGDKGDKGDTGDTGAAGASAVPLPGFYASVAPASIPAVASSNPTNGTIITGYTEDYDDSLAFDAASGIWTCPATGRYDLNATCKLYGGLTISKHYALCIGSASSPGDYFTAGFQNVDANTTEINMSVILQGVQLTAGATLLVKVLNNTGGNYTGDAADEITFSIRKVK